MKNLTIRAKTLDDAIINACNTLNLDKDKFQYEIKQNASKGFLGFGIKECIIEVQLNTEDVLDENNGKDKVSDINNEEHTTSKNKIEQIVLDTCIDFLNQTLSDMKLECKSEISSIKGKQINIEITGNDVCKIIDKNGATLDVLQYLVTTVGCKANSGIVRIKLDADNFRKNKDDEIKNIALQAVDKVLLDNKEISLKAMNAYERRIVHAVLHTNNNITTYSKGVEPYRYVVIKPAN